MNHELKIRIEFCDAVSKGEKNFEIRNNDRGFQKGDTITFKAVDQMGLKKFHDIDRKKYLITYVLSGWGISEGYVALGMQEVHP